jgi:cytidylate kinase
MASERGISVLELSRIAEADEAIDREIDERSARLAATGESLVIDARLAWHFVPGSVKVFLDVRPDVAARRIFGDGRRTERENVDLAATERTTAARAASESLRYQRYYGIDYLDPANYDLVIDTSDATVEEVAAEIVAYLAARRA